MLHPFARALAWYLAGGFGLALLCAVPYFDTESRFRRTGLLALAGPLHPVVALTALAVAHDDLERRAPALASLVASVVVAVLVLAATA